MATKRDTRCPHCRDAAPCNDATGRIAAYMRRSGRLEEWRQAIGPRRAAKEIDAAPSTAD